MRTPSQPRSSRRRFLRDALTVAAAPLITGCASLPFLRKKTLLVFGGTAFTGPAIVDAARERGFEVTLFTRGKTNADLFPELEHLIGDRDPDVGDGLKALEGRSFDAVIDTSGHVPRHMKASCSLLKDKVGAYAFVSSMNAYADNATVGADETAPLARLERETEDFRDFAAFGPLKVLCEQEVTAAFGEHGAIVRPGLIVGPRDRSERFPYWVARADRGGEILAPGDPNARVTLIDSRDLAAFLVELVDRRVGGAFNAVGPQGGLPMKDILAACQRAAGIPSTLEWVDGDFLLSHGVAPWSEMPLWLPPDPGLAGFHTRSIARAVAAGLTFRSIDETAADTLAWWRALPEDKRAFKRALSPERERELLEEWRMLRA
jgi:2'-hydroxyisoflavone reductase